MALVTIILYRTYFIAQSSQINVGFFILKGKIIMTNANRKATLFTLDEEVIELLNKAKAETHIPKSQIVELALEEYLKDYKTDDD